MPNPIVVEITRGGLVESRHTGAYVAIDRTGATVLAAGAVNAAVFPRSAIKAFQCLPVIESGAADRFGFAPEEIALACASHNGEAAHVRAARAMLAKAGIGEAAYECGAHWPFEIDTLHALIRTGGAALSVHNNCSGKHAGMLSLAKTLGAPLEGYSDAAHPVQRAVAATLSALCDIDADACPRGIDGCSVPTWAIPLSKLALGFARFGSGEGLSEVRALAARRIIAACAAHPFMVAGTGRFCTRLMAAVPRAFVKTGAEGVFCACVPHAGLGLALKVDDGASRASEAAMAALLAKLDVWTPEERETLAGFARGELANWRKTTVGEIHAVI